MLDRNTEHPACTSEETRGTGSRLPSPQEPERTKLSAIMASSVQMSTRKTSLFQKTFVPALRQNQLSRQRYVSSDGKTTRI